MNNSNKTRVPVVKQCTLRHIGHISNLSRVGVGNFVDFIRVHPDFVAPALEHGRGEPLLKSHRRHLQPLKFGFQQREKFQLSIQFQYI